MITSEKIAEMIAAVLAGENVSYEDDDMKIKAIHINPTNIEKHMEDHVESKEPGPKSPDFKSFIERRIAELEVMLQVAKYRGDLISMANITEELNEKRAVLHDFEVADCKKKAITHNADEKIFTDDMIMRILQDIAALDDTNDETTNNGDELHKPELVTKKSDPKKSEPKYETFDIEKCKLLVPSDVFSSIITEAYDMHINSDGKEPFEKCVAKLVLDL